MCVLCVWVCVFGVCMNPLGIITRLLNNPACSKRMPDISNNGLKRMWIMCSNVSWSLAIQQFVRLLSPYTNEWKALYHVQYTEIKPFNKLKIDSLISMDNYCGRLLLLCHVGWWCVCVWCVSVCLIDDVIMLLRYICRFEQSCWSFVEKPCQCTFHSMAHTFNFEFVHQIENRAPFIYKILNSYSMNQLGLARSHHSTHRNLKFNYFLQVR